MIGSRSEELRLILDRVEQEVLGQITACGHSLATQEKDEALDQTPS